MKIVPRDYQVEAVYSLFDYFNTHKEVGNPLIAMPTGTGKAVVIAMFLELVYRMYVGQKIIVATHVQELVQQNYNKLLAYWPQAPAGINAAGLKRRDYLQRIIFASIASVYKDSHLFGPVDLLIVDEAHLVSPDDKSMYSQFIADLLKRNPYLRVIGLTATPWRMGQGKLTDDGLFTDICFDTTGVDSFNRFIDEGYLSPLIPKRTKLYLNVDGVGIQQGDFAKGALQKSVDKEAITRAALNETMELAGDRHVWLIFSSGIEHCNHIAEYLNELGVSNVIIHSKLKKNDRVENLRKFQDGEVRCAINYGVLTTGYDHPDLDCIIMLRPTASPGLWVQMLGRGTRPLYAGGFDLMSLEGRMAAMKASKKHNCLVLDFAGNSRRLGPINDPRIPNKKGKGGGECPVKECPGCGQYCHASVRFCGGKPYATDAGCGTEFKFEVKLVDEAATYELIRSDLPVMEEFEINHITYALHAKVGAPAMMRVSYYSGKSKKFSEYVCFQHTNYALHKAHEWWRARSASTPPKTVVDALNHTDVLALPTHIRVWTNKKHPEIMSHCFDGSCFNKLTIKTAAPSVEVEGYINPAIFGQNQVPATDTINWEDDIPF